MSWNPVGKLSHRQFARRGLDASLTAGTLCKEAERLYPGMFEAVSLRNGILKLRLPPSQLLALKMVEGNLIAKLNEYALARQLPKVTAIRVTDRDQ